MSNISIYIYNIYICRPISNLRPKAREKLHTQKDILKDLKDKELYRCFFSSLCLAVSFACQDGNEWIVAHYLFEKP